VPGKSLLAELRETVCKLLARRERSCFRNVSARNTRPKSYGTLRLGRFVARATDTGVSQSRTVTAF